MKRTTLIVWAALIAASGAGFVYWREHKDEIKLPAVFAHKTAPKQEQALKPPSISVVRAEQADFTETALVTGTIVAREETLVSPEVEGYRVLELLADEGSEVKKGEVLARLVSDPLEAQIAQNDANKAAAEAGIARAKSLIAESEARQKEAEAQLERAVPLRKSGYLSQSVFDQRQSAASTAKAQVAAARDSLRSAEAQKAQVEAQRRELDWKRGNTEVKSPADGIVSRRNARVGAMATAAGEPMFRIITAGEVELDAEIVETEIAKVKSGQKAHVAVPGAAEVDGTVRLVSPEIDKTTRLGRAKVFLGKAPGLRIGAFARGTIETAKSHGIAVPPAAVMFDTKESFVQVVTDNKIEKRTVKTGLVANGLIEITAGLKEGDVVVSRAGTFLREGDIIAPVAAARQMSSAKTAEVE